MLRRARGYNISLDRGDENPTTMTTKTHTAQPYTSTTYLSLFFPQSIMQLARSTIYLALTV